MLSFYNNPTLVNYFSKAPFQDRIHLYHIITPSAWPYQVGFALLFFLSNFAFNLHGISNNLLLKYSFIYLIYVAIEWLTDVNYESAYEGSHTTLVQNNVKFGFALFIISEIMFFFSFFWAFFHSSLAPTIQLGAIWPPFGMVLISPWGIPAANTALLLYSGVSVTLAHKSINGLSMFDIHLGFICTIFSAFIFELLQVYEYTYACFSICDGIYGSLFFMTTGFHGFHVLLGMGLLLVCYFKVLFKHNFLEPFPFFDCSVWYWHFVDIVWVFVYFFYYWWSFTF